MEEERKKSFFKKWLILTFLGVFIYTFVSREKIGLFELVFIIFFLELGAMAEEKVKTLREGKRFRRLLGFLSFALVFGPGILISQWLDAHIGLWLDTHISSWF